MASGGNFLNYFFGAGLVVKFVMLILIATSIVSWTLILQRAWFFKQKKSEYNDFSSIFWNCSDLNKLYASIEIKTPNTDGLQNIFYAGFKEFIRVPQHGKALIESMQRVMQIAYTKEAEVLEKHLPLFASVGSLAPYVGLFGTVWGIMTSFQALGQAQQATIAMVAPGISEALIATALGLFTAIPAVVAFNRYSTSANSLLNKYELFQEELIALISEQTPVNSKG